MIEVFANRRRSGPPLLFLILRFINILIGAIWIGRMIF